MKSGKAVGPDDIPVEVWKCLGEAAVEFLTSLFNRVLEKYVRVVQDMYERSRTVVKSAVGQTEEFKVEVGLHQGSALSPFLFAIVMDQLSEEVRQESPWTMMFADDIEICSESREQVEENLESFALERRGMKVSRSKTEYMCVNETVGSGTVRLQGEVQEFKYLGSTVQSNGECGKEVKKRVQGGWNGWRKVSGVLCDRKISARIKGKVYRTVVRPVMLYGLETVSLRKRQESELEVAELKMLRFSLGVTRLDNIMNEYIRGTAHVGRLGDKVRGARLRWFGHVQKREREEFCHSHLHPWPINHLKLKRLKCQIPASYPHIGILHAVELRACGTVVKCAVGQTEEFKVEVGLHQGSALSPFLFAIVMDQLSEEVRQESPWTMMFADDIVICSESREQVEENLERWRFALERRGMKVSRSKTEYMCVNEREGSGTVRLQGEEVKKVQEFKYLGSTVQSNGECGKEDLEHKVITLIKNELKRFRNLLRTDYPACTERKVEDEEDLHSVREGALKITLHVMENMNHSDLANTLQNKVISPYQQKLKSNLREKCKRINEGISQPGISALLKEIYTELFITEGWSGDVNNEHEVRQIETVSRRPATQDTSINCNDLFKDKSIRTVLTKGVAGIGKTVSVQKFILDWSEGKANQDITFMFPLPFRELNLMKEKNLSLMNLLHHFFPEIIKIKLIDCDSYKVVFILDGLDECRLPLNFQKNEMLWDVAESASVDVLLTNLIKGNLLPSALLWITSRPATANQIPPECVGQVTEVRGFSDPQKEEYFRKRISDQNLANKIITHMKSSRSLYIMCHIPVFCWISATVLERMLDEAERVEIPKTLTQMFTHFLIFQIKHKHQKYHQKCDPDPQQTRECILALGKLAFQQLEKGNLIFYEEDLRECGIDVREVSVYSGVCTQIFRKESGLHLGKCAVDKTLESENGHLDLFLRFLLGLSLESNQTLLRGLIPQTGSSSHSKQEIVKYIKEKIRKNPSPEKSINLFHCLNELNDHSLVQEVQTYLNRGDEELDDFNLSKYDPSEEGLLRLLPVVKASRKADLYKCDLTEESCRALSSVLTSNSSRLRELNLSGNKLQDSGVKLLSDGLKNTHCTLEILDLCWCNLTEESCRALSSVLTSNSSRLRELNLSDNKLLQDSGVKLLSDGLKNPHCTLEILNTNFILDRSRPGLTTTAIGAVDLQGTGGNWATVGRRSRGGRRVRRQREKRKGKSVGLRIGTLNVGTMTGKGRELADMMERRKVDILCVQETRWKGSKARSIGAGFKLFYYGVDSKRNGVGVVLKEEFVRNVLEVKRVSDRVMNLKLEFEGVMLNVVSGYAPQVGCELEEKERFWSELDEVMESIPTGERVVIGADFNGHVGEGNTGDEEVMGKFGVKERNLEGQMVVDFAKRMDMAVVNTYFQKREA
ncbi:hypothetical protein QTP70_008651 [Hemibagrus guttatus]|uniref:ribonuclease H n=1 Tax=Hemibagrus guttatus TaxID=175788 RepID=A0AAE0QAD1_9TELE|nr:hypothetical protein QTP70_008651 [Hemibagrus guttatus]